jgi:hypothetical protein
LCRITLLSLNNIDSLTQMHVAVMVPNWTGHFHLQPSFTISKKYMTESLFK